MRPWLKAKCALLRHKGWRHWLMMLGILVLSSYSGPKIYESVPPLNDLKYALFQWLSRLEADPPNAHFVKLIMIGDDPYWNGPLQGRTPFKRDYLAALVDAIAAHPVKVIALDFSLRTLDPRSIAVADDYRAETDLLMQAIIRAAEHSKIVLTKAITQDEKGLYYWDADVYQAYGICAELDEKSNWTNPGLPPSFTISPTAAANIRCGYDVQGNDERTVPGELRLHDGKRLESFAFAAARALEPGVAHIEGTQLSFAGYLPDSDWKKKRWVELGVEMPTAGIPELTGFTAPIAVVGGEWNKQAHGRGEASDMHPTPVGQEHGAVIHANLIEAILGHRTIRPTADWLPEALELILGLMAGIVFSLPHSWIAKFFVLAGVTVVTIFAQWVFIHWQSVFFEAFVPVAGIWLHSLIERVITGPEKGEH